MARRLRVLVSAYACSPIRGSEPGMGWAWVEALSKHHDLWIITEKEKFQSEIEDELHRRPELRERMRFYYLPKTRWRRLRKVWPPSYYWFYRAWQKDAHRLAIRLHAEVGFDVVHQLNMQGFREPGFLWKLDLPFVWGPIGGTQLLPWRFLPSRGLKGAVYYGLRNLINSIHLRTLRRPRKAARLAGAWLITASTDTQVAIRNHWGIESKVICGVGLPDTSSPSSTARKDETPLRLIWSGLHIARKALDLLLRALALLPAEVTYELDVLGAGPMTRDWKQLATRHGIASRCIWHGWLSRNDALGVLRRGHVFVMTSQLDLVSTVILEALAYGVPVISSDRCGFQDVVTPDCGILIPARTPACYERDHAAAIERLWRDEPYRRRLAEGAPHRARLFAWEDKAAAMHHLYREAIDRI